MQITTTHGLMDDALLMKKDELIDNENEQTEVTEYWLDGECVHRSVHVTLKKCPFIGSDMGAF